MELTKQGVYLPKPQVPEEWDYQASVRKMERRIYRWRFLTKEILDELWIAHHFLGTMGPKPESVANATDCRTWEQYCQAIGADRSTVYRWFQRERWMDIRDQQRQVTQQLEWPEGRYRIVNRAFFERVKWDRKRGEWIARNINRGNPELTGTRLITLSDIETDDHESSYCQRLIAIPDSKVLHLVGLCNSAQKEASKAALLRYATNGSGEYAQPQLPVGTFEVIYPDPPWHYDKGRRRVRYDSGRTARRDTTASCVPCEGNNDPRNGCAAGHRLIIARGSRIRQDSSSTGRWSPGLCGYSKRCPSWPSSCRLTYHPRRRW